MSNAPRTLSCTPPSHAPQRSPGPGFSGSAFDAARSIDFQRYVNRIGIALQQHEK